MKAEDRKRHKMLRHASQTYSHHSHSHIDVGQHAYKHSNSGQEFLIGNAPNDETINNMERGSSRTLTGQAREVLNSQGSAKDDCTGCDLAQKIKIARENCGECQPDYSKNAPHHLICGSPGHCTETTKKTRHSEPFVKESKRHALNLEFQVTFPHKLALL
jgi:hypothetical protein